MESNHYKSLLGIPNFIILIIIAALFLIDFLPHSTSIDILYPQFLYLSVFNFLTAVYLYLNRRRITADTFLIFKKSYLFWSYLAFIILSGLSFVTAKNSSLVIEKLIELMIAFSLFVNLTILLKNRLYLISQIILIVCVAAFLQSSIELYHLKLKANETSILTALTFMAERAGNINILATSLTIKIPFLLIGLTRFSGLKKVFMFITLLCASTTIFLTGSRTAILSIVIIYTFYIIYYLKTYTLNRSSLISCVKIIIPVIMAVIITNLIFKKTEDNGRYSSVNNRIKQINTKDASANLRLVFWDNTIQLAKTSPLFGVGLGNYKVESIPYEKTQMDDSTISLHSHNDFLEITAEAGILNGLLYISIFAFVFFVNAKRILNAEDIETKTIAILVLMLTIVYVMDSLLNFPMFRPTMLIFLCLLLVLTLVNTPEIKSFEYHSSKNKIYLALILISVVTIYFTFLGYKASNLEYVIQKDNQNSFVNSVLTGDELIKELPKYKTTLSTAESFYEYAGIYYMNEKKYDEALKYLSKANKINSHLGRIDFYKMLISNAKENRDSAYIYAKEAFYLRPRNLNFFKMSAQFARAKKDTPEILKEHKLITQYRKIPQAWQIAAEELQKANYDNNKILNFIDLGLKEFRGDSILTKQKNDILVSNYIKEGRSIVDKDNSGKELSFYIKALKLDPQNADIMQNMAFYYYNKANYKQSLSYFLDALKYKNFNSGRTEFFIGNCYLKLNDKENACKYFRISNTKNFPDAKQQIIQNCK
ncbi:O-antigen ligase family protein [Pseudomonas shirazensis]